MISSDGMRGYNDMIILHLILNEPSYGYNISRRIREISDNQYIIKETTLYSAFTRLEKSGYIHSFYGNETGGSRRTYYEITEDGRTYYKEKCGEWNTIKDVVNRFCEEMKGE